MFSLGNEARGVVLISYFVFSKFDGLVLKTLRFLGVESSFLRLFYEVPFEAVDKLKEVFAFRVTRITYTWGPVHSYSNLNGFLPSAV